MLKQEAMVRDEKVAQQPLCELSQAISQLRTACKKLQDSVRGINTELEETNTRLVSAVRAHSEVASYLTNILSSIPSGVIVVDREGRIVLFNKAAENITGYRATEVTGRHYSEVFDVNAGDRSTPLFTLVSGYSVEAEEKRIKTISGELIPVSFSTSLILDENSEIKGAVEVITDLRRLKLLEEEISRVKTLATIGEMAAVVAHEVRNPLGGIKGFASLLRRDLIDCPDRLALLDRIIEGIQTLERIVSDLLDASRPLRLELKQVDLANEIRNLVEIFRMATVGEGKSVIFETEFAEEPFYCRVDVERLKQAIMNLLRNAVDAVGDKGNIRIALSSKDQVSATGTKDGHSKRLREYISIEVADDGPGISEELLEKIFSPFFTTKEGGNGLGLSQVKKVAAMHGGEVRCERLSPRGSKFVLAIPRW